MLARLQGVSVRYGDGPHVLDEVSLELQPGSFHFLTGLSGSGKSTLLRLLQLGLRPQAGRLELFGRDVAILRRRDLPWMRRQIGIVFQDFRLLPHLSAYDNVALPLRLAGEGESLVRRNVPELLRWVGLGGQMWARPETLSGGQQQRVAIARAVIARPALLLADEPTGNLDEALATRLLYLFDQLHRHGTTVVLATHSQTLVRRLPHPRLVLEGGRLRRDGPAPSLADGATPPDDLVSTAKAAGDLPDTPAGAAGGTA